MRKKLSVSEHKNQNFSQPFNFRINAISFSDLIQHYESVQFLYPAKKKQIQPIMPLIAENWEKALKAGDQLLWIASSHRENTQKMSTISLWRSTLNGWVAQHLTSNAGPTYVHNILTGTQLHAIENQYRAGQNWFQPTNKYANSIFGSIESTIGKQYARVSSYQYYYLNATTSQLSHNQQYAIVQCKTNYYQKALNQFLHDQLGAVYMTIEEWDQGDIELSDLNEIYLQYGLFRYRSIWMAFHRNTDYPAGVIIAYRGPTGFNFSLIENRMELILDKKLDPDRQLEVASLLIDQAKNAYAEKYPLKTIPLIVLSCFSQNLAIQDLAPVRIYKKSSWINKGFKPWCRHVALFFNMIAHDLKESKNCKKMSK
jgi:hypothetical protein